MPIGLGTLEMPSAGMLSAAHRPHERALQFPPMSNTEDRHKRWRLTSQYMEHDGVPAVPVSGEMHFSRLPRSRWEERLRLMKAGGITVVACYIFWIHHEPVEGEARFDGNRTWLRSSGSALTLAWTWCCGWARGATARSATAASRIGCR